MKKLYFLLFLCLLCLGICIWYFLFGIDKEQKITEIDVTDTGFEYDIEICDQYFDLLECIIDKDPNQGWSSEMRYELKNQIKALQEDWKQLSEQELIQKCSDELENYERSTKERNLDSFGCFEKFN